MNRNPSAFGKPRTNSSMRKNKYHDEEEAERLAEIARKTEFNEINFPSLGGYEGWGGQQTVKEQKNKWVELASDWKIHDIVEKQYADMKKDEEERKKQEFSRIIPTIYVEKTNFGTTHSKHEDTYEEDPYVEYPSVSSYQEENSDDGWNTVVPKPKKVKKSKTKIEVPSGPPEDNEPSIWENDDNTYEIIKARSGAY